jgi:hypothetical protein
MVYKHADADIIPGTVDVPIQRIRLCDIGYLALLLGFKKVVVNCADRHFEAVGDYGTISTLNIPGLGKVLHFEGDILYIYQQISLGSIETVFESAALVDGRLSFGPGYIADRRFCPLHLILEAADNRWDEQTFARKSREYQDRTVEDDGLAKGEMAAEGALFDVLHRDIRSKSMEKTEHDQSTNHVS